MITELVNIYAKNISFELCSLDGFSSCAMLHDNELAFKEVHDIFYVKLDMLENHPVMPE
ncbi:35674_t:CDS:1, partial [Racocetra persica]